MKIENLEKAYNYHKSLFKLNCIFDNERVCTEGQFVYYTSLSSARDEIAIPKELSKEICEVIKRFIEKAYEEVKEL